MIKARSLPIVHDNSARVDWLNIAKHHFRGKDLPAYLSNRLEVIDWHHNPSRNHNRCNDLPARLLHDPLI